MTRCVLGEVQAGCLLPLAAALLLKDLQPRIAILNPAQHIGQQSFDSMISDISDAKCSEASHDLGPCCMQCKPLAAMH